MFFLVYKAICNGLCLSFLSYTYDYNGYLVYIGLFTFAINSSIYSDLIFALNKKNDVTLDV